MTRKSIDSEERWQRARRFYQEDVLAVMSSELPAGVQGLILYIQDHFDLIRQKQEKSECGGGALYEYETQLIIAVSQLGEKFSYLVVRELLEDLFSDVFSVERIIAVGAGSPVISQGDRAEVNKIVSQFL